MRKQDRLLNTCYFIKICLKIVITKEIKADNARKIIIYKNDERRNWYNYC